MAKRRSHSVQHDIREAPLYLPSEASFYLAIPKTTLSQWFFGRKFKGADGTLRWSEPLLQPADPKRGVLSFANLAEAHLLQATRDRQIPMANVRHALDYVKEHDPSPHPLLTRQFYTHGKGLFIKALSETLNASKSGQVTMTFMDPYLERLVRDQTGLPFRLFPMRANPDARVMLDLHIASGQPVVRDTGILANVLYERNQAGETEDDLARDYGLDRRTVEDAIRYIEAAA